MNLINLMRKLPTKNKFTQVTEMYEKMNTIIELVDNKFQFKQTS